MSWREYIDRPDFETMERVSDQHGESIMDVLRRWPPTLQLIDEEAPRAPRSSSAMAPTDFDHRSQTAMNGGAGMTFYATNAGKQVAHDAGGEIILDFGKHYGDALRAVPTSYLGWMTSMAGQAFLPADLLALVGEELQARSGPATEDPAGFVVEADRVLTWAAGAPAGDVHELTVDLRALLAGLDAHLTLTADAIGRTLALPTVDA